MTRRSILIATTWAGGAFALGLAGLLPVPLGAADPSGQLKQVIETPTLTAGGSELSVRHGADGVMELVAKNTSGQTSSVNCTVLVQTTAPTSPMARVMPRPKTHWQKELLISLAPDETKVIALDMPAIPQKVSSNVLLISGTQRIVALSSNVDVVVNFKDLNNSPNQR